MANSVAGVEVEEISRWRCPACPVTMTGELSDVLDRASMHWSGNHGPLPGQMELLEEA
jgi:hypothetical protein